MSILFKDISEKKLLIKLKLEFGGFYVSISKINFGVLLS